MHGSPEMAEQLRGINLGWVWSSYNLITIGAALIILLDVPKPDLISKNTLSRFLVIPILYEVALNKADVI